MWMFAPGRNSGRKKPRPCRWSRCRWVRKMCSSSNGLAVHRRAERPDPGAGVEDEQVAALEADLDARRVAAVANRVGAGRGQGAAAAPDPGFHYRASSDAVSCQKTLTTPCISSPAAEQRVRRCLDQAAGAVVARHQQHAVRGSLLDERDAGAESRVAAPACRRDPRAGAPRRTRRPRSHRARRTASR